jgi:hypothetical protein
MDIFCIVDFIDDSVSIYSIIMGYKIMKRQSDIKTRKALAGTNLVGILLLTASLFANATTQPEKKATTEPNESMSIQYDQGLMKATIKKTKLSKVIQALEAKTSVHFELNSSEINNVIITATIDNLSLQEGIRDILYGYSYAIDNSTGTSKIIVLSLPIKASAENNNLPVSTVAQNEIPISPPLETITSVERTDCPANEGMVWNGKYICPPI